MKWHSASLVHACWHAQRGDAGPLLQVEALQALPRARRTAARWHPASRTCTIHHSARFRAPHVDASEYSTSCRHSHRCSRTSCPGRCRRGRSNRWRTEQSAARTWVCSRTSRACAVPRPSTSSFRRSRPPVGRARKCRRRTRCWHALGPSTASSSRRRTPWSSSMTRPSAHEQGADNEERRYDAWRR